MAGVKVRVKRRAMIVGALSMIALLCAPTAGRASTVHADFNGDGFADLAIGIANQTVNGILRAGAVSVIYGSSSGLSATASLPDQLWHRDVTGVPGHIKKSAKFGSALAIGDFNGDSFDDLAIGVPYDKVSDKKDAGSLTVIYGSEAGLSSRGSQLFSQDSRGVKDATEAGDRFASSLATGDFNNDGDDDLAVGVPIEGLAEPAAGGVNLFYGTPAGLSATSGPGMHFLQQDSPGIEESAGENDEFGAALASADLNNDGSDDLVVGVPDESFGAASQVGIVQVIYGSPTYGVSDWPAMQDAVIQQGNDGYEGTPEQIDSFGQALAVGDFNADGIADLAIGSSDHVGSVIAAGAIAVVYGASPDGVSATAGPGNQLINEDSPNIPDMAEAGERFSEALAVGDFNSDGVDDVAVGNQHEDLGSRDEGSVTTIYGKLVDGLVGANAPGATLITQGNAGVQETAEAGDAFGSSVAAGDFDGDGSDDVAIGAPSEALLARSNVGVVHAIYGDASSGINAGNSPNDQLFSEDSPDIEGDAAAFNQFGSSLSTAIK